MWRHYVYIHRRADDGLVFYVGKGTVKSKYRYPAYDRANESASRNTYWHRVVAKHGFVVEVIASFATDLDAQLFERETISAYGRKNLVNLTDGGDGCAGIVVSEAARRKLSEHAKKPRGKAWIESIRKARNGGGNGGVVKHGDKLPDWWKKRIADAKFGERNPMYGKTGANHPNSRKVVDRATGATYDSVQLAADALGLKMKTLYNWLSGHRKNPTTLELS